MNERTQLDLAWRMHDSAAQAIDKADTKAGFAATVETALAAVVLTLVSQSHDAPLAGRVLFGVALVALAVALGSALLVVVPRLHRPADALVPGEFLYFGAVRLRSIEQLSRHIVPRGLVSDIYDVADPGVAVVHQAKRLADIAWTKHRWLRVSFLAAVAGGIFAVAGVLIGGAR
ncbi:Pycsar system effector family protein [Kribbella sp. NPDC049174]|uniref:Pycsar system effector family protein n=1 Tax=Kribbella sp. NPDC049174 TaxID=3364112 RepID=UPI00371E4626